MTTPLVEIQDLSMAFGGGRGWFGQKSRETLALDGVSLSVPRGTSLGVVGESGSGKSTLALLLTGLLRPTRGRIVVDGRDVSELRGGERRALHRTVQMVFQQPGASLNPRRRVGRIVSAPLRNLLGLSSRQADQRLHEVMDSVHLDPSLLDRYPHELSGGQAQRVAIARALAAEPELLVLDEPTSALDVTVQAQILRLLDDLRRRLGLTYLFISHDLPVVEAMADRVAVLHRGRVVEQGNTEELFAAPKEAYTRQLIENVP